jgi:hypothetical protein
MADANEAVETVIELPAFEYTEDWADIGKTWDETLNKYGADGWQLKFVLMDEFDEHGTKHAGRRRLIFERECADSEDE